MTHPVKSPRKLIEVALPLDAINAACAREKSIRHGHPSTLHLWWARRPLAAARAVIFAQMVNDPGYQQGGGFKYGKNKKEAAIERKRLFGILEDLVKWESTTNDEVLERARKEIRKSWREVCELNKDHPQAAELFDSEKIPGLHDPFAGGGAIPLEAQRLGLEAYASDLNPVAVLINKAMIEIPPKFAGLSPVGPLPVDKKKSKTEDKKQGLLDDKRHTWKGAQGLAEDVRRYGAWMRDEAFKRIGHLYPPVVITAEMAKDRDDLKPLIGHKLSVIAWLWARTVKSPNPAFSHIDVPLASTFVLSSKGEKSSYIQPIVKGDHYKFTVKVGVPPDSAKDGTKLAKANFGCIFSGAPINTKYIRNEACNGRMGKRLMAIVAEGEKGRVFLSPTEDVEKVDQKALPEWKPDLLVTTPCHDIDRLPMYGMFTWGDAFTSRQLVAMTTFCDLISEIQNKICNDAVKAGFPDDKQQLFDGGNSATAYAQAVSVYLAFALNKVADRGSTLGRWDPTPTQSGIVGAFSRQALPMTWDFAESNPLGEASGNYISAVELVAKALLGTTCASLGYAIQNDASTQTISSLKIVSTDPPYYNNIGYADLSDFFYVWLRRSLTNPVT